MTFCDYYAELSGAGKVIIDKLNILDQLSAEERQVFDSKTLSKLEVKTITEVYNILVVDIQGLTNVMVKWSSNPLDVPNRHYSEHWLVDDLKYSVEIGYIKNSGTLTSTYQDVLYSNNGLQSLRGNIEFICQNVFYYKNELEVLKENIESMGYSFLASASE